MSTQIQQQQQKQHEYNIPIPNEEIKQKKTKKKSHMREMEEEEEYFGIVNIRRRREFAFFSGFGNKVDVVVVIGNHRRHGCGGFEVNGVFLHRFSLYNRLYVFVSR